jgi:hypothetical protein
MYIPAQLVFGTFFAFISEKHLMKITHFLLFPILILACSLPGCIKSSSYSVTNHTVGVVGTRAWSGTISGYEQTDTVRLPDTAHVSWASPFSRTISDTTFNIEAVNGFLVSVLGTSFNYISTDSTHGIVLFDTTLAGSATSKLTYYYAADSITYEYHHVTGYNAASGLYYQVNAYLHTVNR